MHNKKESLIQKVRRKREELFEAGKIRAEEIQKMKEEAKKTTKQ